ncbi:MAG: site-specific integrase [Muribaculaceae bacterium]|nr:site-specific integrase [Muribaculaceae bacterium]
MASVKLYRDKNGVVKSIQIRVFRGKDETGKHLSPYQKSVSVPAGTSERQLEKLVQRETVLFEEACKSGQMDCSKILFRDFAKQAMETKAVSGVAKSTLSHYQNMLDNRILPRFGYMKVRDISGIMLDRFYREMITTGQNKKTGKPLSPKTVLEYHRLLSTIFALARKQHIILHNPAEDATPPTSARTIPNYFQPEQLAKIRDAFDKEPIRWKLMGNLLMLYGDRRSEFAGIRCSDIDFNRHILTLRGSVLYNPQQGVYAKDTLKNGKSRELLMTDEIEKLMREYLIWRAEEKEKWGGSWVESGYLFTDTYGKMMNPDTITQYLDRMSKRLQKDDPTFPHLNPHAFRHTVVSNLLANGVDVVSVASLVGDDPATITAHYAHIITDRTRRAVITMENIVRGQECG